MAKPLSVRIISGTHRGRKVTFTAREGLRPTPDRVRETLFNWLQTHVPGSRVLDAYAGTGALGLECLSRGASDVVFCETHKGDAQALSDRLQAWQLEAKVMAQSFDRLPATADFDLIFLDPPFGRGILEKALEQARVRLKPHGLIVIEHEPDWALPAGFSVLKQTRAGTEHLKVIEVS